MTVPMSLTLIVINAYAYIMNMGIEKDSTQEQERNSKSLGGISANARRTHDGNRSGISCQGVRILDDGTKIEINRRQRMTAIEKAMKVLTKELIRDHNYRESWKANIAMAYKDNWGWYKQKTGKKVMSAHDRHVIVNQAADYFLDLICRPKKK